MSFNVLLLNFQPATEESLYNISNKFQFLLFLATQEHFNAPPNLIPADVLVLGKTRGSHAVPNDFIWPWPAYDEVAFAISNLEHKVCYELDRVWIIIIWINDWVK